ncbi:MAG: hypothetical protein ACJAUJ_001560 [Salibacteraceae bacterium]
MPITAFDIELEILQDKILFPKKRKKANKISDTVWFSKEKGKTLCYYCFAKLQMLAS